MKKLIAIIVLIFVTSLSFAQTQTENYVQTTTYKTPVQNQTEINTLIDDQKLETITYYDGLGRPKQNIVKQAGGNHQDIVTPIIYDNLGRKLKSYLPYVNISQTASNANLNYRTTDLISEINSYYSNKFPEDINSSDPNPYFETVYENSPINRPLKQGAPGFDWKVGGNNDHTIKYDYLTNETNEVKHFSVSHPNNNKEQTELVYNGTYAANILYKTVVKDENWQPSQLHPKDHTAEEFKDQMQRLILERTYNEGQPHDTYYVYDDYGNLSYVIPPLAADEIVNAGSQGFRVSSQTSYSWTDLIEVNTELATESNKKLSSYENESVKNTDLNTKYHGQGGFTVTTLEDSDIVTLTIGVSATQDFTLKLGELLSLKEFGEYKDTEMGRLGEYIFLIKNNAIVIEKIGKGAGLLSNINQTFSSNTKLSYSYNHPWVSYTDVDEKFANSYEKQLSQYANADILNINIENEYGGQGGLNITIDENDILSLTINSSSTTPLKLKQGLVIPLKTERRITDREIGQLSGEGYQYRFAVKENSIYVEGEGTVTTLNAYFTAPPLTIPETINTQTVEGLCYIYHYDYRNRIVEKKSPSRGWEYIIYDTLNRPVLTQDTKQKLESEKQWSYYKYDVYGRIVYTGELTNTSSRLHLQNAITLGIENGTYELHESSTTTPTSIVSDATTTLFYTNNAFPIDNHDVLSINYYDDYSLNTDTDLQYQDAYGQQLAQNTKSLTTVTKLRVLETNDWITTVIYYDDDLQPIYTVSKNEYLNTLDIGKSEQDFIGKTLQGESTHIKSGQTAIVTNDTFTYDHAERLLTQVQTINGGTPELIINNTYDELGLLINKKVGGTVATNTTDSNGLQSIDLGYNIRGWLTTINNGDTANNNLFGYKINYNTNELTGATENYNGNISEIYWKTANDNKERSYDYQYDALDRLKKASYHGNYLVNGTASDTEDYSLNNVSYDKNGNITALKRTGFVIGDQGVGSHRIDIIDDLTYNFSPLSNQLTSVYDTATKEGFNDQNTTDDDYSYDINGNLTVDENKNIVEIQYNNLDLPTQITIVDEQGRDQLINYVYDASGTKLSKKITRDLGAYITTSETLYAGAYIYSKDEGGIPAPGTPIPTFKLQTFTHPEGYVEPQYQLVQNSTNGSLPYYELVGFNYVYQYIDHLGNVRLTYADLDNNGTIDATSEIIEENNFYPFGLKHNGYNNVVSANANAKARKFTYNGIEYEDALGLNLSEMFFRLHDPAIGRWNGTDIVTHYSVSPYSVMDNNPVVYADPSGANSEGWNNSGISRSGNNFYLDWSVGDPNGSATWFSATNYGYTSNYQETIGVYGGIKNGTKLPTMQITVTEDLMADFMADGERTLKTETLKTAASLLEESIYQTEWYVGFRRMRALKTAADITTDFIPLVGAGKDIYNGISEGNYWLALAGVGFFIADIVTLGSSSVFRGSIKTGIKQIGTRLAFRKGSKVAGGKGLLHISDDLYALKPIDGYVDVLVHGTPTSLLNTTIGDIANNLAKQGLSNTPIRLCACNAGALSNGIAKQLANATGQRVIAPTGFLHIWSNGMHSINNSSRSILNWTPSTGEWRKFFPD